MKRLCCEPETPEIPNICEISFTSFENPYIGLFTRFFRYFTRAKSVGAIFAAFISSPSFKSEVPASMLLEQVESCL